MCETLWNFQNVKLMKSCFFPQDKSWKIVNGLGINSFSQTKMDATAAELMEERDTALAFLGVWLDPAKPPDLHLDKTPDARLWHSPPNPVLLHIYICMYACVCVWESQRARVFVSWKNNCASGRILYRNGTNADNIWLAWFRVVPSPCMGGRCLWFYLHFANKGL